MLIHLRLDFGGKEEELKMGRSERYDEKRNMVGWLVGW